MTDTRVSPDLDERVSRPSKWQARRGRIDPVIWLGILAAVVMLFLICYPVLSVVVHLFYTNGKLNFSAFHQAWSQSGLLELLRNTVILVVVSGFLAIVAGGLFAWFNERTDASLGSKAAYLPLICLVVPPLASSIGWTFLLDPRVGFINEGIRWVLDQIGIHLMTGPIDILSWPGLIIAYSAYLATYAYLPIAAAFRNLDPALEEASRTSGAGALRTMIRVTLPAIAPSLASAAALVVTLGLALYSIPSIIAYSANIPLLTPRIVEILSFSYPPKYGAAVVLSLVLLVGVVAVTSWQARITRRGRFDQVGGRARAQLISLGRWRTPVRVGMLLFAALLSIVPVVPLIIVSLQPFYGSSWNVMNLDQYKGVFGTGPAAASFGAGAGTALRRTLELGLIGATILVVVGGLVALSVSRIRPAIGRWMTGVTSLPASLSHPVILTGFILVFAGAPFHLGGTLLILLLAYITVYLPQAYFGVSSALSQVGGHLLEASSTSGAGAWRTMRKVTLPLSAGGLFGAWALAFALILSDLTASTLLGQTKNTVVGYEVVTLYRDGTYPELAALAVVITIIAALVLLVGSWLVGRFGHRITSSLAGK